MMRTPVVAGMRGLKSAILGLNSPGDLDFMSMKPGFGFGIH